jgi:hypothetical protein
MHSHTQGPINTRSCRGNRCITVVISEQSQLLWRIWDFLAGFYAFWPGLEAQAWRQVELDPTLMVVHV